MTNNNSKINQTNLNPYKNPNNGSFVPVGPSNNNNQFVIPNNIYEVIKRPLT